MLLPVEQVSRVGRLASDWNCPGFRGGEFSHLVGKALRFQKRNRVGRKNAVYEAFHYTSDRREGGLNS